MRNKPLAGRLAERAGIILGLIGGAGGVPLVAMLLMLFLTACGNTQEGFEIRGEIPMESKLIISR